MIFVAIEGPDGVGKTTQVEALRKRLALDGPVQVVPGCSSSPIGKMIRRALAGEVELNPLEMQVLYTADRIARVHEMNDSLISGKLLLADRWTFSALVYGSLHIEDERDRLRHMSWLARINREVCAPSLYLVLDAKSHVLVERLRTRGGQREVYERDELVPRIVRGYQLTRRIACTAEVVFVDADREPDAVTDDLVAAVQRQLRLASASS